MKRTLFQTLWLALLLLVPLTALAAKKKPQKVMTDREYWCSQAYKMAQPVLENMAKGELQKNMQTEFSPSFDNRNRKVVYMETFGRLMAGLAPWLSLPDDDTAEGKQRRAVVAAGDQARPALRGDLHHQRIAADYFPVAFHERLQDAVFILCQFDVCALIIGGCVIRMQRQAGQGK